jgi:adenine/guanine/hypoxanthine permease
VRQVRERLERYFQFRELGTDWRTEVLAGFTTFVTMAYIIFVNPSILHEAGMPAAAVIAATCLSSAIGSLLMGAFARYPIALAPGMGLNAYFTYSVVKGMGVSWQTALGAVFLSGVAFLLLTAVGIRQLIVSAIPAELYSAVAAGIGLFIAFIGLRNAGMIISSPATSLTIGDLRNPQTLLALFGLLLISTLLAWGVKGAMLIGIAATVLLGGAMGLVPLSWQGYSFGQIAATAFQLDVRGALRIGVLDIVFVFLFVDLFDNLGTLLAVSKKARLIGPDNSIPRLNRILFADAVATTAGSLAGTSTVVSYVESAAGVVAGGRTGITSIVVGLLFLLALFVAPLAGAIPTAATAPALIVVGSMMISHVREIEWDDVSVAVPSFLTLMMIPLSFSIANGLAFGLIAYTLLRVVRGQWSEVNWLMYVLTGLFILRFAYLARH